MKSKFLVMRTCLVCHLRTLLVKLDSDFQFHPSAHPLIMSNGLRKRCSIVNPDEKSRGNLIFQAKRITLNQIQHNWLPAITFEVKHYMEAACSCRWSPAISPSMMGADEKADLHGNGIGPDWANAPVNGQIWSLHMRLLNVPSACTLYRASISM